MIRRFRAAPLSSTFFLASILGLLIAVYYRNKIGIDYAVSFIVLFAAMFIASVISMAKAPIEAELAVDHDLSKSRHKVQ